MEWAVLIIFKTAFNSNKFSLSVAEGGPRHEDGTADDDDEDEESRGPCSAMLSLHHREMMTSLPPLRLQRCQHLSQPSAGTVCAPRHLAQRAWTG
jgi:hypothetical protein